MNRIFLSLGWILATAFCFREFRYPAGSRGVSPREVACIAQRDSTDLSGQWFLLPVLPSDTAAGRIPTIYFDRIKSRFTGHTGCNRMSGSFQRKEGSLVFDERSLITTKMACPGFNENAFLKSLLRTNSYKIEKQTLILMMDATELSRWTRKPAKAPLTEKA